MIHIRSIQNMICGLISVAVFSSCCSVPKSASDVDLIVRPGYGIENVCELGMTFSQIKRLTPGVTVHKEGGSIVLIVIPSAGAMAMAESKRKPIDVIKFYTRPFDHPIRGAEISAPFKGAIGSNGLSFAGEAVARQDVENEFGAITNYANHMRETVSYRDNNQPFCLKTQWGTEWLVYYSIGMIFEVEDNEVIKFECRPPFRRGSIGVTSQHSTNEVECCEPKSGRIFGRIMRVAF